MSNTVKKAMKLHREAMNFSEKAQIARIRKEKADALASFREAFRLEKEAAMLLKDEKVKLVTRAVLFRSAAVLALDCGEINEVENLINLGLSGEVPPQIADELQDLKRVVESKRRTKLHEVFDARYFEHNGKSLVAEAIGKMYSRVEKDLRNQSFENDRKIKMYAFEENYIFGPRIPNFPTSSLRLTS